jgi:hypothetical protein
MNIHGQNEVQFSFECGEEIASPFVSSILIKLPNGEINRLYKDSISNYKVLDRENFNTKGQYSLSVYFEAENYAQDSIDYDFELKGDEIKTTISVDFDFRERLLRKGEIYEKGEKVLNGYIRINKYYNAPKTIDIWLDKENMGTEFYKGPFFKIKNNSTDTLYGEHLPGYFWGTFSYLRNDSAFITKTGILDYNFMDSSPLYPDSTKIASVGSFGLRNKLVPFDYRFEVTLAKVWQSTGIGIYDEHKNFIWWAGTKEYYKLVCDFKIE